MPCVKSKSSIIHDIWEPEEAKPYGEHSFLHLWLCPEQVMTTNVGDAEIAVCIFIPDLPSFNPCLTLGFTMINFVKNHGKEGIVLCCIQSQLIWSVCHPFARQRVRIIV